MGLLRLAVAGALFAISAVPSSAIAKVEKGSVFPDLVLTGENGKTTTVGSLRGQVVFLQFWGTWCAPCVHEMPYVNELWEAVRDEPGVAFLMVPIAEDLEDSVAWMREHDYRLPVWHAGHRRPGDSLDLADGSRRIASDLFINRVPQTFILDTDGRVVFHHINARDDWPEHAELIRSLLPPTHERVGE